jgi:hypothetical protein
MLNRRIDEPRLHNAMEFQGFTLALIFQARGSEHDTGLAATLLSLRLAYSSSGNH